MKQIVLNIRDEDYEQIINELEATKVFTNAPNIATAIYCVCEWINQFYRFKFQTFDVKIVARGHGREGNYDLPNFKQK